MEAEGRADEAKGDLKQAGEQVKDVFKGWPAWLFGWPGAGCHSPAVAASTPAARRVYMPERPEIHTRMHRSAHVAAPRVT
jgi:hypothetical protein